MSQNPEAPESNEHSSVPQSASQPPSSIQNEHPSSPSGNRNSGIVNIIIDVYMDSSDSESSIPDRKSVV